MSAPESVRVVGADRCAATLDAASRKLGNLPDAPSKASTTIASEARRRAPKATGTLAASIVPAAEAGTARVRVDVRYGWPVESGVRTGLPGHMEARPFLADARDATEAQWSAYYAGDVDQVMGTVKGA